MGKEFDGYEVGYGKPPRAKQFQKGASGNPKGRPKGSKNLQSIVMKESKRKIRIDGPRGPQNITMLDLVIKQLLQKAAKGDLRASREFIVLVQQSEQAASTVASAISINELDQGVLKNLERRLAEFKSGEETK
jgi:hypothetical protein